MSDFRGASADAVAALTDKVKAVPADSASRVAEDLFSSAVLIRNEGALRRFVTDASQSGEAKGALVQQLFGAKVGPDSLGILTDAVARRWTVARDLADALEDLSVIALVGSVGGDSGRLADELFDLGRVVSENPELRDALSDPGRSIDDKSALLEGLLSGKALPATITLARQSLSGSYRTVNAALSDYEKIAAAARGEGVATVRVARPLHDGEAQRLAAVLSRTYGRDVHLNVLVDPDVLGGIRVEIGDDVIDGTVAGRLADARRRIAG